MVRLNAIKLPQASDLSGGYFSSQKTINYLNQKIIHLKKDEKKEGLNEKRNNFSFRCTY